MDQTINQKRTQLQSAQQELKWLEDKLPASQTRQQAISERARRWEELNKELWKLETELNWVNRELWEADRLVKKYQDEIDWIEKWLQETTQTERNNKEWRETNENVSESETKLIESRLNSELEKLYKNEKVKLDRITKAQFETWVFIEWVHRRFKNISLKPNIKMPKKVLKKLRDKIVDMKNKWGKNLSEYYRKLVDKSHLVQFIQQLQMF